jgi:hypothetical protein
VAKDGNEEAGYYFDKVIRESQDFSHLGITEEVLTEIKQIFTKESAAQNKKIDEILQSDFANELFLDWGKYLEILREQKSQSVYIHNDIPGSLIVRQSSNEFFILSKNIDDTVNLFDKLNLECEKIGNITKDFGLTYQGLISGKEYACSIIEKIEGLGNYKINNPKNSFESTVIAEISKLTNSILTNIEIAFKNRNETFEYDILLALKKDLILDIEITDYDLAKEKIHENNVDTLKSQVILSPIDKAQLLGAKLVIIARGFPDDAFTKMKELATSRKVLFLSENDFYKSLEKLIMNSCIPKAESYESMVLSLSMQNYFRDRKI